jgi:cbb3-type cytochrome oxidase subunit 1
MPALSAHALRLAFCWGALGALLGGLSLAGKAAWSMDPYARQLHMDLMLYGWMMQVVFATAYWIFPRIHQIRPTPALAVTGFVLWNSSLAANAAGLWYAAGPAAAAALRLVAAVLLVIHFVPRLRPVSGH